MSRRAAAVRVPLRVFRALTILLPRELRTFYRREAGRDLEDLLIRTLDARGAWAALRAGAMAVLDLGRSVVRERWGSLWGSGNARSGAPSWWGARLEVLNELRLASRSLLRRPGFTVVAVLTLALGIGASVAIFTVVNAVLLRPLPYPDADRIVHIRHHAPGLNLPTLENSPGTIRFYREQADFLETLVAYDSQRRNLVDGGEPSRIAVLAASQEIFEVLGVQPALGRAFTSADAAEGAAPTTILMHTLWSSRFGRDPAVLGRTVDLDGVATEVVGVMPDGFRFADNDAVALTPLFVDPAGGFGQFGTGVIARLSPDVSLDQARRRAAELQARLPATFPDLEPDFLEQTGWSVSVRRFQDVVVGEDVASALWIVLATVVFVLLIACANVANLFLVRAESRQKELVIRSALGAGRGRIAAGFLTESLVLGVAGGVVGVLLAWAGVTQLVAAGPTTLPRLSEVRLDGAAWMVGVGLSVLAGLAFGAVPLARGRTGGSASHLRDGDRGTTVGKDRHRARNTLVAAQLALALVLLVGSGLMLRSFQALRAVNPGFDPADVVSVGLSLGEQVSPVDGARFYRQVADEVYALPGVESVGLANMVPIAGGNSNGGTIYIESKPLEEGELKPVAMYKAVGADYFATMRQSLVEGRALGRSDWESGQPVAVVNQEFADRYLDGQAMGERIKWDEDAEFATVVGVVADVREFGLQDETMPWAYLPLVVGDWGYPGMQQMSLLVRTREGLAVPVQGVRDIVGRLNARVPITTVQTMEEALARDMAQTSCTMLLLAVAAVTALLLGAIGLFGVISYVVSQRTREIGIRMALGARGQDIRRMVMAQGSRLALVGVVLGLLAAFSLTRLMQAVLFQVGSTDALTFLGAPLVLVAVTLVATWLPARRASTVDPVISLRSE